ncbi:MAG: sugar-binding transcriptional regulator [Chloroflexi bacterium]|nr:sugar-binding transcriptional regulator [Chloroflexota bacterium]
MARKPNPVDLRLLSKVSKLYYEQDLTQQEISERLRLSRPKVSRLIQQAHKEGIVQITVLSPQDSFADLEQALEQRYHLQEAVVVEIDAGLAQEAVSRQIGIAAANYLQRTIQHDDVIGVFWGVTLNGMVNALQPCEVKNAHVVQMVGGLGPPEAEEHATGLCRRMARLLNGTLTLLPAPGLVDTPQVKDVLLTDSYVQGAFDAFASINVAYIGIGSASPTSWIMRNQVLTASEIETLQRKGAVGETALRFFDDNGQPVYSNLDHRVIGITLDDLKQVDRVVGMAGGPEKDAVVRAALNGSIVDVLITDHILAERILA